MTNHPKTLEEALEMFDVTYKCIQNECDGNGNIPVLVSGSRQISETEFEQTQEWSADQCQFHAEYLFPIKELLTTIWHAGRESVVQDCEGMKSNPPVFFHQDGVSKDWMQEDAYKLALSDVITKLSELKK